MNIIYYLYATHSPIWSVGGNHWSHTLAALGQELRYSKGSSSPMEIDTAYVQSVSVTLVKVMKKFLLRSSCSSDVKKGTVNEEKSEDLTRKVFHEKHVKKTNVATNRAYRAYMQVQSDI